MFTADRRYNPGRVPNGAKCGDNSMCIDWKCVDINNLPPSATTSAPRTTRPWQPPTTLVPTRTSRPWQPPTTLVPTRSIQPVTRYPETRGPPVTYPTQASLRTGDTKEISQFTTLQPAPPDLCNCNGHGTCNQNNECQCDEGWSPPFCNTNTSEDPLINHPLFTGAGSGKLSTGLLIGNFIY